ncbi:MAG TPA: tetratricopeptide repeat protein [Steroidobacteraceae bacterium]|nr:tetratricopeptide repeat protein [Steroidobacteraceae bacterium]
MRIPVLVLYACAMSIVTTSAAWAAGGGSMSMPSVSEREQTPQEKAKELYNRGVRAIHKADKYQEKAAAQTDAGKKDRATRDAQDAYADALDKFQQAVQNDSDLYEAWNYVGYTNRKLGHYDVALTAYERALALHPGYPEALEYRGEAYLGLSRVSDAQQAYLDLFASDRKLADKLLGAMKGWLDAQRGSGSADANTIGELDKWIQERTQIAGQTAALTRSGTAAAWN